MLVKILVFSRDYRLNNLIGDGLNGDKQTPLIGVFGQKRPVSGVDPGHYRRFVFRQNFVIGKVLRDVPYCIGYNGCDDEGEENTRRKQISDQS